MLQVSLKHKGMKDQADFGLELEALRQLETIGKSVARGRTF